MSKQLAQSNDTRNPHFDFLSMSPDAMTSCLAEYAIALTPDEAQQIQQLLKRAPTLAECVLWGIQGSEHCAYKSSRRHLKRLTTDGPNVILGAKEDAGIIRIASDHAGHHYGLAISHESHNHPSQVVPFEGAATGIGGNVRDVCCMGARVLANADSLRFGDITQHKTHVIANGVVKGIENYGNVLGIPNLAGDIQFDSGYDDNCLVTAVTLGLVREDHIIHSYAPENAAGYDLILVGKPTDNSGFGGASFSSDRLDEADDTANRAAVQEPNAFLGRVLLQAHYALFDKLVAWQAIDRVGFKDLGAGGVACASIEIAETAGLGAKIYLENVHVSMDDLIPTVILCSETQERYLWVCPPDITPKILQHYNQEFKLAKTSAGAKAVVVGQITNDGQYQVFYHDNCIVDAKASAITKGIVYDRPYTTPKANHSEPDLSTIDLKQTVLDLLQHPNIANTAVIYENYDKQVQGRTIIERGQADAGVIQPFNHWTDPTEIQPIGIALAVAHNAGLGKICPYTTGVDATLQAMAKVIAVGAMPQAITDCLCFGNPENPVHMGAFVASINGIKTTCESISLFEHPGSPTPIVAGNVSLYNESHTQSIPASPMIACIGKLTDVQQALTPALKQADNHLILLGQRQEALAGSQLYHMHSHLGNTLPQYDLAAIKQLFFTTLQLVQQRQFTSLKAINLGGLAIAVSQMAILGNNGFNITLAADLPTWFAENIGFIAEVTDQQLKAVECLCQKNGISHSLLGKVTAQPFLQFNTHSIKLKTASQHWHSGLREKLW